EEAQAMAISRFARVLARTAALIVLLSVVGYAQDSGQVLRVFVGYGTLKNTPSTMNKLSPEAKAEVDKLEAMARKANGDAKYGEALKHLYHAMALMRGMEWTPARALNSAVTVKLDRAMLDPGESVPIKFGQIYALDEKINSKVTGFISLSKMRGEE